MFPPTVTPLVITDTSSRKLPLLAVATAATEPKLQNGAVVRMAPGLCVTPAGYTTLN